MSVDPTQPWRLCDRFLKIQSHWFTLIGEHLEDTEQNRLEYWRIEKPDSVIILPIQNSQILVPPPSYRPGMGEATLDLPGGRVPDGRSPLEMVPTILERELGISPTAIQQITPLNTTGWGVNSSFSNQRLYGMLAAIAPDVEISLHRLASKYPANSQGLQTLLQSLTCLQCRAVLLEWWIQTAV